MGTEERGRLYSNGKEDCEKGAMLAQASLERILGPVFCGPLSFYVTNHEKTTKISNCLHALTMGQVGAESPHTYLMEFLQTKRAALPFTTEQI